MSTAKRASFLTGVALIVVLGAGWAWAAETDASQPQSQQESMLVGRIAHVEGLLMRYVPEEKDWAATGADTPVARDDSLYTDEKGKAEIILPNDVWARMGAQTQLQLLAIEDDYAEFDLALGVARFSNKGAKTELRITTPYGYLLAPHDTVFDLYVGDKSVEVTALQGTVDFVHTSDESRFEVVAKSSCLLADAQQVTSMERRQDAAWDKWNAERDALWSKRFASSEQTRQFLPEPLYSEAYSLQEHGRWESVQYEGAARTLWRPSHVAAGWAPFTVGHWAVWNEEQCWIPAEPFGYVTHHYGNWVWAGSAWYWAPPVIGVNVQVGVPFVNIGLAWYPGRVAWIHSSIHHQVGWVTLAPDEIFYAHRYWGPGSVIVGTVGSATVATDITRFRFHSHAVVVRESSLYRVNSYLGARIRHAGGAAFVSGYRYEPVLRAGLVADPSHARFRYHSRITSRSVRVDRRIAARVHTKPAYVRDTRRVRGAEARERVSSFSRGRFAERASIERPRFHMASLRETGGRGATAARAGWTERRSHGHGAFREGGRSHGERRAVASASGRGRGKGSDGGCRQKNGGRGRGEGKGKGRH